jgi:N-acyl amino acid synthase of PEP-CTERM/exosortase system
MNVNMTQVKSVEGGNALRLGEHYCAGPIDDVPELLERSYHLRYQVYCLERNFLPAEDYPCGLEIDAFDQHAIHIGALDRGGELAGTVRLVKASGLGLPMFPYCTLFPDEAAGQAATPGVVEIGRLSVSRSYRRRRNDGITFANARGGYSGRERRRHRDEIFLTMTRALYQESKRIGATDWLVATEKSLQRLLAQYGFPFRQVGPERDYFGVVAPYRMNLDELDRVILSGGSPCLGDFFVGLEPELRPRGAAREDDPFRRASDCSRPTQLRLGAR